MEPFHLSLAPERLWQAINPWSFYNQGAQVGLVNISLGNTARPDIERRVLDEVGSYGRQIGRMGDALEVLMRHLDRSKLSAQERDILAIFEGQLAEVRKIKDRERGREGEGAA
jgi:hypothetical protein